MKVTIQFDEDEDEQKIETLLRAFKYKQSLEEIVRHIRQILKYSDVEPVVFEEFEKLQNYIYEVIDANDSPVSI